MSDKSSNKVGESSMQVNGSCTKLKLDEETGETSTRTPVWLILIKLAVCSIAGILFGIAFEKSRVFEPKAIRLQMVFESFIMLKMFLSAVAAGQIVLSLLSVIPPTKKFFEEASAEFVTCFTERSILTSVIGAFALGAGMTLSGACPGMVLAQLGAWAPNSIFTLLGAFIGALSYGMLAPYIIKLTKPKKSFKSHQVYKTFNKPYILFALPMAAILGVIVFIIEYYWECGQDLVKLGRLNALEGNIATMIAWPPYIAGILIGLLQVPIVLAVKDTLGGSSSYVTLVSQWVVTRRLQELFPYLAKKRCGLGNWWQVFYVCGAIVGAAISAVASNSYAVVQGCSLHTALLGGILMLWGARFAAGCTSGHGLSGMGLLAWFSFLAVPAMFAGAIVTAFSMRATGALDHFVNATLEV